MVQKKYLSLLSVFIALAILGIVLATTNIILPVSGGNYTSATAVFNCTTVDLVVALNATLYYNASGGLADVFLFTMFNDSADATEIYNDTVDSVISSLDDGRTYNFTCYICNETACEYSDSVDSVTIDNTAPAVNFITPANGTGVASGLYVLNISINDTGVGTLSRFFINITNMSGTQNATFNLVRGGSSIYYSNATGFNVSTYAEGRYAVRVYANDSLNNINNSELSAIYVDRTAPSAVTLTAVSTGQTTVSFNISIVDAISGINAACTVNRSGTPIIPTGTGLVQNVSDSGLTCGNSYVYNVSCSDVSGNANTTTYYPVDTLACDAVDDSSSSGSTGTSTTLSATQLASGYTTSLYSGGLVIFTLNGTRHTLVVITINSTNAKIRLTSNPITATFARGEEKNFDLDNNTLNDLSIKLNNITGSRASFTLKSINETLANTLLTNGDSTTGDLTDGAAASDSNDNSKGTLIIWIIIVLVIIVLLIAYLLFLRIRKRKRYWI